MPGVALPGVRGGHQWHNGKAVQELNADSVIELTPNPDIQAFAPGDTVRVYSKVIEGGRERTQMLEGVVIRVKEGGPQAAFTVRRVTHGVVVERTFLPTSPRLEKVEVVRRGKVRRAVLHYLRGLTGKAARIKEKGRIAR
ncbi:MAG: 50S ribosomal protein L19 [Chloroflexi bacterium]|nr:50S ribosomal protein L19 [Chloroflexota bacterium]